MIQRKITYILFSLMLLHGGKTPEKGYASAILDQRVVDDHNKAVLYQQAIQDSMSPGPNKVYTNLVPINDQNDALVWKTIDGERYLLVVTWKQDVSYYKPFLNGGFYNTSNWAMWVTTAPELLERMHSQQDDDVDLRLKQLLGLPPNSEYSYFVEFWVRPADLFRPCPDSEITDEECDLCFPEDGRLWKKNLKM